MLDRPALRQDRAVDRPRTPTGRRRRRSRACRTSRSRRRCRRPTGSPTDRRRSRSGSAPRSACRSATPSARRSAPRTATRSGRSLGDPAALADGDADPAIGETDGSVAGGDDQRQHDRQRERGRPAPSAPPRATTDGRLPRSARSHHRRSLARGLRPVNAAAPTPSAATGRGRATRARRTNAGSTPNTSRIRSSARTSSGAAVGDDPTRRPGGPGAGRSGWPGPGRGGRPGPSSRRAR